MTTVWGNCRKRGCKEGIQKRYKRYEGCKIRYRIVHIRHATDTRAHVWRPSSSKWRQVAPPPPAPPLPTSLNWVLLSGCRNSFLFLPPGCLRRAEHAGGCQNRPPTAHSVWGGGGHTEQWLPIETWRNASQPHCTMWRTNVATHAQVVAHAPGCLRAQLCLVWPIDVSCQRSLDNPPIHGVVCHALHWQLRHAISPTGWAVAGQSRLLCLADACHCAIQHGVV